MSFKKNEVLRKGASHVKENRDQYLSHFLNISFKDGEFKIDPLKGGGGNNLFPSCSQFFYL